MLSDLRPVEGENNLLDTILNQRVEKFTVKIAIKVVIAVVLIIFAIVIPQICHLVVGKDSGVRWMPMFLPVLLAGCLFGIWWGLGIGILSPIVSFGITSIWKKPMPTAERLGFMVVELAIFGLVPGLFSKKIATNKWIAFPAVLLGQLSGIVVNMIVCSIFSGLTKIPPAKTWESIQLGMVGNFCQAILVPFITIGIRQLIKHETKEAIAIP